MKQSRIPNREIHPNREGKTGEIKKVEIETQDELNNQMIRNQEKKSLTQMRKLRNSNYPDGEIKKDRRPLAGRSFNLVNRHPNIRVK